MESTVEQVGPMADTTRMYTPTVHQEEYSSTDTGLLSSVLPTETDALFKVVLPERSDEAAVGELLVTLSEKHQEKRGVITLCKSLRKYLLHTRLANDNWENSQVGTNFVNGIRSSGQQRGDKKRSLRSDAEDFYDAMTTPMLRLHCKLFDVYYDGYSSIEEVVAVLVQKHVDMIAA